MSEKTLRGAAFFDLDRTLIEVNSGYLYAKHERKAGRISSSQFMISSFYIMLYYFSLVDIEAAYRKAATYYRGASERELEQRTWDWFDAEVEPLLLPGARAALDLHREANHPLILLTSSSSYVSERATQAWGLDGWLANHFGVDENGLMDGEILSPLCYGEGKIVYAERWAEENQISLEHSYFYTDSYSDRAMLHRVGHPRVVNPDPRLRRLAQAESWPIHDWTDTEEAVVWG